jgi:molybdopterin-containing oxidoreductase family iron-sulfur binding subunit
MSNQMIDLNRVGAKGALAEGAEGKWGMVIDRDICTGCQACVAACAMENNISFVGEEDAGYGRTQHWIRIERLWEGEYPNVKVDGGFQPMLCQQCGQAPCEPVCPVFATPHSAAEQINLQVYNRCIGTRYCANNCPYQVRSFNWRDYHIEPFHATLVNGKLVFPLHNQFNPDVTVRRRGVMEKCTFCIQRIHSAQDKAKSEGREVEDGEFTTACAQACPASAITFGRLDHEESLVSQLSQLDRGVQHLEELNTLPRVTYLKKG